MGLFDIYSKEHRRIIMAKETIKEMLEMIDAKIEHIEDISADNRAIIVKLVKQSNQIVEFLKNLEIDIDEQYGIESPVSFSNSLQTDSNKIEELKELWEDFKSKREDLKEFEEELKKHKDKLTPGQVGES
jgi:DNA repair ATPase RecN